MSDQVRNPRRPVFSQRGSYANNNGPDPLAAKQASLCQDWSETQKPGFVMTGLQSGLIFWQHLYKSLGITKLTYISLGITKLTYMCPSNYSDQQGYLQSQFGSFNEFTGGIIWSLAFHYVYKYTCTKTR